jgi:hypothetical protein
MNQRQRARPENVGPALAVFLPLVLSLLLLIQYCLLSLGMFESRSFKRNSSFAVFLLLFSEEFSLLDFL